MPKGNLVWIHSKTVIKLSNVSFNYSTVSVYSLLSGHVALYSSLIEKKVKENWPLYVTQSFPRWQCSSHGVVMSRSDMLSFFNFMLSHVAVSSY